MAVGRGPRLWVEDCRPPQVEVQRRDGTAIKSRPAPGRCGKHACFVTRSVRRRGAMCGASTLNEGLGITVLFIGARWFKVSCVQWRSVWHLPLRVMPIIPPSNNVVPIWFRGSNKSSVWQTTQHFVLFKIPQDSFIVPPFELYLLIGPISFRAFERDIWRSNAPDDPQRNAQKKEYKIKPGENL